MDIRSPFKAPFKKPQEDFWSTYLKSGDFQGSIKPFKKGEVPPEGDLRLFEDGGIYTFSRKDMSYTKSMSLFKEGEIPEDGAMRVKGNAIYQFSQVDKSYNIVQNMPKHFMRSAPFPSASPFKEPGRFTEELVKNIPRSISNLVEGMTRLMGDPTNPALLNVDAQRGQYPTEALFPKTFKKVREEPHALGLAKALMTKAPLDIGNIATAPAQLAGRAAIHPISTLREDPAGFAFGIAMLKGGMKLATGVRANAIRKGYLDIGLMRNYVESIPAEKLAEYGVNKEQVLADMPTSKTYPIREMPGKQFGLEKMPGRYPKLGEMGIDKLKKPTTLPEEIVPTEKTGFEAKEQALIEQADQARADALQEQATKPVATKPSDIPAKSGRPRFYEPPRVPEAPKGSRFPNKTTDTLQKELTWREDLRKQGNEHQYGFIDDLETELRLRETTGKLGVEPTPIIKLGRAKKGEPPTDMGAGLGQVFSKLSDLTETFRQSPKGKEVMRLIKNRRRIMATGQVIGEEAIGNITKNLSPEEANALPFVREGMKNPEILEGIGKGELIKHIQNPSPALRKAVADFGKVTDKDYRFMQEHFDLDRYVDNYVSQIWDIPKKSRPVFMNYFKKNNPFLKRRIYPSLEVGIKMGAKPKTTNIAEIYRLYNKYKWEVYANKELLDVLKNTADEVGQPLITSKKNAPPDYKQMEHPVFGADQQGYVHPDIFNELNIVWKKVDTSAVGRAYDKINALVKYSQLSLTLFHHGALTESALGTLGALKTGKVVADSMRRMATNKKPYILEDTALTKDATQHGVRLQSSPDIQINAVEDILSKVGSKIPEGKTPFTRVLGAKAVAGSAKRFFKNWNKFLWDHLHNTYKAMSYEKLVSSELPRMEKFASKKLGRALTEADINAVKDEIGQFINDSFGGQNWDTVNMGKVYFGNPKMRQALQRMILAPDWTISVIRQATSPFRGNMKYQAGKQLAKEGLTELGESEMIQGKALRDVSTKYWGRMYAYSFLITQAVNRYTTQKYDGKAKWTWENDPGNEYRIFMGKGGVGKNIEGEPKIYLRFGKQISEPWRYFTEPDKILGGKMSPLARLAARQITRHDPGTGWPTAYAEDEDWKKRIEDIATIPIPFSLKTHITKTGRGQFLLMYPLSTGMTRNKTEDLFRKAFKVEHEGDRIERINRVYMAALENGLKADEIFTSAKSKSRIKEEIWDKKNYLNTIREEIRKLPDIETKLDLLSSYRERKSLTPFQQRILTNEITEKQEVIGRMGDMEKENQYIRRITPDKYLEVEKMRNDIRDDFTRTKDEALMTFRQGKKKEAILMVKAWNDKLKTRVGDIKNLVGKPIPILYKNYHISIEEIRTLYEKSRGTKLETTLERQIK